MDIGALLKMKQAWAAFNGNHPKFLPFLNAVKQRGMPVGTVVDISVKYPDGGTMHTNISVKESDLELINAAWSL